MKLVDVINFRDIYGALYDKQMPIKVAYKLSKLAHKAETESKFYHDKLQEIVDTYVEKDENGQLVYTEDKSAMKIIAGKEEECSKAMTDLQSIEVDIEPCFTIDELDGLELSPLQMQTLYSFIIE